MTTPLGSRFGCCWDRRKIGADIFQFDLLLLSIFKKKKEIGRIRRRKDIQQVTSMMNGVRLVCGQTRIETTAGAAMPPASFHSSNVRILFRNVRVTRRCRQHSCARSIYCSSSLRPVWKRGHGSSRATSRVTSASRRLIHVAPRAGHFEGCCRWRLGFPRHERRCALRAC